MGFFQLVHHAHVAVVAENVQLDAPPVARRGLGASQGGVGIVVEPVVVGVALWLARGVQSRAVRVVGQGGQHHRMSRDTYDLDRAADPVVDFLRRPGGRETRVGTVQLHYQGLLEAALQPESAVGVVIRHHDFVAQHVHDVRIVPDGFGGQGAAADLHAVDLVIAQAVSADQGAMVVGVAFDRLDLAGAAAPVGRDLRFHRIGVDADHRPLVTAEDVLRNHRLRPAHENRGADGGTASVAVAVAAVGVVFQHTVSNPHVGLVDFDGVEAGEATLDGGGAAGIGDQRAVDARPGNGPEVQAAPIARRGSAAGRVLRRDKRSAGPVTAVQQGSERHLPLERAFGDELGPDLGFDPCPGHLDDYAGIDRQPGVESRLQLQCVRIPLRTARGPLDDHVLRDHVDDVGVVEAGVDLELVHGAPGGRVDPHEDAVEGVLYKVIAVDLRPHSLVIGRENAQPIDRVNHGVGGGGRRVDVDRDGTRDRMLRDNGPIAAGPIVREHDIHVGS